MFRFDKFPPAFTNTYAKKKIFEGFCSVCESNCEQLEQLRYSFLIFYLLPVPLKSSAHDIHHHKQFHSNLNWRIKKAFMMIAFMNYRNLCDCEAFLRLSTLHLDVSCCCWRLISKCIVLALIENFCILEVDEHLSFEMCFSVNEKLI